MNKLFKYAAITIVGLFLLSVVGNILVNVFLAAMKISVAIVVLLLTGITAFVGYKIGKSKNKAK